MKIAIVGVGGVGGYFGGLLAWGGNQVTFVARGEHGRVLREQGLTIKSVLGDFVVQPVTVVESAAQLEAPDLVLFTVKTYDTTEAARELAAVVGEQTVVITFQNGADNDLRLQALLPQAQIYPGVCYLISAKTSPGIIEQTGGLRKLLFGDRTGKPNSKLQEIAAVLQAANIDGSVSNDITRDIWKKFIFITAFSGMTALTRKSIGEVIRNPDTLQQYEAVVRESIAVAQALGVNVPADIFELTMQTTRNTGPTAKSSLLLDIEHGRKNEIETLNGTLVTLAKQVNVAVPMNTLIYERIHS